MAVTVVHTRTHAFVQFADPNLVCNDCRVWVDAWHSPEDCGCGDPGWWSVPCGHRAGISSLCPSWSPVDGCRCERFFGRVDHPSREAKSADPA